MNATDRLGRDMLAAASMRWITLVITAFASSFLLGLLMLSMQRATLNVSRSVTTPASPSAPNWNAEPSSLAAFRQ